MTSAVRGLNDKRKKCSVGPLNKAAHRKRNLHARTRERKKAAEDSRSARGLPGFTCGGVTEAAWSIL